LRELRAGIFVAWASVAGRSARPLPQRPGWTKPLPMTQSTLDAAVTDWLSRLEKALSAGDAAALAALFHSDGHWRDVLALTWRIETVSGRNAIVQALEGTTGGRRAAHFAIDPDRTPPRPVMRAGRDAVEAIFRFETAEGR